MFERDWTDLKVHMPNRYEIMPVELLAVMSLMAVVSVVAVVVTVMGVIQQHQVYQFEKVMIPRYKKETLLHSQATPIITPPIQGAPLCHQDFESKMYHTPCIPTKHDHTIAITLVIDISKL